VCKLLYSLLDIKLNQYSLDEEEEEEEEEAAGDVGSGGGGEGGGGGGSRAGLVGRAAARALRAGERRNLEAVQQRGIVRMKRMRDEGAPDRGIGNTTGSRRGSKRSGSVNGGAKQQKRFEK